MSKIYFTLTGLKHYHGSCFLEPDMKLRLKKDHKNHYDSEAIEVKTKILGKIGYVANSPYTVEKGTWSAGRLYDKIGEKAKAKVVYNMGSYAICELSKKSLTDECACRRVYACEEQSDLEAIDSMVITLKKE